MGPAADQWVCFGHRPGGVGETAFMRLTRVTGDQLSVFMEALITAYGYTGNGYWGGRWNGNTFNYNTAVTRVNTNIVHNTYVNNSVTKT